MKSKLTGILIGSLIGLAMFGGLAWAQTLWQTSVTVNIVNGSKGFEVYLDPAFTMPADSYDFGDTPKGSTNQYSFWVMSTGNQSVYVDALIMEDISNWASYQVYPLGGNWVPPGAYNEFGEWQEGFGQYLLRLKINDDAWGGGLAFTLQFYEAVP